VNTWRSERRSGPEFFQRLVCQRISAKKGSTVDNCGNVMVYTRLVMVNCEACGASNPEKNKFCGSCGQAVTAAKELRCSACDYGLTAEDRFCPNCATPVTRQSEGVSAQVSNRSEAKADRRAESKKKDTARKGKVKLKGTVLASNPLRIMPDDATDHPVDADPGNSIRFMIKVAKFVKVGDEVEVSGRWSSNGTLRPRMIRNLRTGVTLKLGRNPFPLFLFLLLLMAVAAFATHLGIFTLLAGVFFILCVVSGISALSGLWDKSIMSPRQ
jgi:Double zinc ribbon